MKAVVMAGGEGTRLRPLTSNQPKPMVSIVGKPCMEHILELLKQHGMEDVIVTVAFLPQAIRSYFGDGTSLGLNIGYSVEESPLGTAGSVRLAADRLDDTFLVISGDALCDVDLTRLIEFHREKRASVTIGLKSVDNPLEFGIVVTVAFLPQAIRSYFGGGETLGVDLSYSVEESPLGTAGSVRLAADRLDDTFLVISGDALCDVDLTRLIEFHREKGASVTIGLKSVDNPLEFGIVVTDDEGRIERFLEKPSWGQVFSDTINTGIYVLEPEVLRHIPTNRPYDFSKELFPLLLEMGRPIYCYV
jgi:NDP-sugar pyrophosphorylase family protein